MGNGKKIMITNFSFASHKFLNRHLPQGHSNMKLVTDHLHKPRWRSLCGSHGVIATLAHEDDYRYENYSFQKLIDPKIHVNKIYIKIQKLLCFSHFNFLPRNKISAWSKLRAFADDKCYSQLKKFV